MEIMNTIANNESMSKEMMGILMNSKNGKMMMEEKKKEKKRKENLKKRLIINHIIYRV